MSPRFLRTLVLTATKHSPVGEVDGADDGATVGAIVGGVVGATVGPTVGVLVGPPDGGVVASGGLRDHDPEGEAGWVKLSCGVCG